MGQTVLFSSSIERKYTVYIDIPPNIDFEIIEYIRKYDCPWLILSSNCLDTFIYFFK